MGRISKTEQDRRHRIIALARVQHHREGEVEIDNGAKLSEGDDNGCYVAAWVWCDYAGTEFDKDHADIVDSLGEQP